MSTLLNSAAITDKITINSLVKKAKFQTMVYSILT